MMVTSSRSSLICRSFTTQIIRKRYFKVGLTLVSRGISDISDGSGFYDVPNDKFLDGLVLGAAPSTVGAPNEAAVSAVLLISSVVPALDSHFNPGIFQL